MLNGIVQNIAPHLSQKKLASIVHLFWKFHIKFDVFRRPFTFQHKNSFTYLFVQSKFSVIDNHFLVFQFGKNEDIA